MYHTISAKEAAELNGKEVSVKEFLDTSWTDHVYLVPADREKRGGWIGVPQTNTREDSEKLLREKYINHRGIYIDREKDFGNGAVAHWLYFGVIVSPEEYDEAIKNMFAK